VWNPKLDISPVCFGVKFDELVKICDEFEEDQPLFGPQIELDLGTGSNSILDLGEPPIEVIEEVYDVVVIGGETSEEGKTDLEMRTGDMPAHRVEGGDSFLEATRGTLLKRWEK